MVSIVATPRIIVAEAGSIDEARASQLFFHVTTSLSKHFLLHLSVVSLLSLLFFSEKLLDGLALMLSASTTLKIPL